MLNSILGLGFFEFIGFVAVILIISYFWGYYRLVAKLFHGEEKEIEKRKNTEIHRIK